nr:uncharacterized protein LOC131769980 [Pocillopora verrucosa]
MGAKKVPYLEVNTFPSYHADNLYDMIQWIKILLPLFQKRAQRQGHQGQPNGEGIQQSKVRYKETVSTAVWVQMTLLACYLPYGLVGASKAITGLNTPSLSLALTLSTSLLLSNSTINPFLYCWRMREIKQDVKEKIRRFCCLSSEET